MLQHLPLVLLLLTGMVASVLLQKLTIAGALTGGAIGLLVYGGTGYTGIVLMAVFFVLGTAATAWHKAEKVAAGVSSIKETRRTAGQVLANAGVPALVALIALFFPGQQQLWQLLVAASFSSAAADTLSSELGNVYGSHYFNVLTWKRDQKGLDGAVSWEGTTAGLAGSLVIAIVYSAMEGWQLPLFWMVILAGTFGNFFDSVLGATLERKGSLHNNAVNFLNTLTAALLALFLYFLF